MSYESTLAYIHSVSWKKQKPGLERTRFLLHALGNPEKKLKFIHVAGTNGKGSTCACLASVLRQAGYRTGLYTSPYLIRFNERMQIDGETISDDELEHITDHIRPIADSMEEHPTEFELITAIAMVYFASHGCDIVVLEVGLGGELDSTNVIESPECSVITAMGLDHTRELGPDIVSIARAKAGIIKPGRPVAIYGNEPEANAVFRSVSKANGSFCREMDRGLLSELSYGLEECSFTVEGLGGVHLPLIGTYQPWNALLAVETLWILRENGWHVTDENILRGLSAVAWPGRFELLRRDPVFILDGAHNPHGIAAAAESLKTTFPGKKIIFILGVMADKDVGPMLAELLPIAERFLCVTPHNPRAMEAETLAEKIRKEGGESLAFSHIPDGVREAIRLAGEEGVVCALGSLYFSGDIRKAVQCPDVC